MSSRKVLGLDIGSSTFRIIEAELNKDESLKTITSAHQHKIPTQVVGDGTIISYEFFLNELVDAIQKSGVKTKDVFVSINGESILTRTLSGIEKEKNEEIFLKTLPFTLESLLPITMSENYLGYHVINEYVDENFKKVMRDILLVALTKSNLDEVIKGIKGAKLNPTLIDIAPLNLLRASVANENLKGKRIACVDIGGDITTIAIHKDGYPEYVRIITGKGGKRIDRRIADELKIPAADSETEKFKALGRENVIEKKSTSIFGGDVSGIKANSKEASIANSINMIVAQELTSLVSEIRDTFTDAETFHGSTIDTPIEAIVLSGAASGLQTLSGRIQNELGVPVTYSDTLEKFAGKALLEQIQKGEIMAHEFAAVAGLVYRGSKAKPVKEKPAKAKPVKEKPVKAKPVKTKVEKNGK